MNFIQRLFLPFLIITFISTLKIGAMDADSRYSGSEISQGIVAFNNKDYATAQEIFFKVDSKIPERYRIAQRYLGAIYDEIYQTGWSVLQNSDYSLFFYKQSAELGDMESALILGKRLLDKKDYVSARRWLTKVVQNSTHSTQKDDVFRYLMDCGGDQSIIDPHLTHRIMYEPRKYNVIDPCNTDNDLCLTKGLDLHEHKNDQLVLKPEQHNEWFGKVKDVLNWRYSNSDKIDEKKLQDYVEGADLGNPDCALKAGEIYERLKHIDNAIKYYKQAAFFYPEVRKKLSVLIKSQEEQRKIAEERKKAKEKADRKAKQKAAHKAKEEAERKAKEKALRLAKEEADRTAKVEADRIAKAKAEREAKQKADRQATKQPQSKPKKNNGNKNGANSNESTSLSTISNLTIYQQKFETNPNDLLEISREALHSARGTSDPKERLEALRCASRYCLEAFKLREDLKTQQNKALLAAIYHQCAEVFLVCKQDNEALKMVEKALEYIDPSDGVNVALLNRFKATIFLENPVKVNESLAILVQQLNDLHTNLLLADLYSGDLTRPNEDNPFYVRPDQNKAHDYAQTAHALVNLQIVTGQIKLADLERCMQLRQKINDSMFKTTIEMKLLSCPQEIPQRYGEKLKQFAGSLPESECSAFLNCVNNFINGDCDNLERAASGLTGQGALCIQPLLAFATIRKQNLDTAFVMVKNCLENECPELLINLSLDLLKVLGHKKHVDSLLYLYNFYVQKFLKTEKIDSNNFDNDNSVWLEKAEEIAFNSKKPEQLIKIFTSGTWNNLEKVLERKEGSDLRLRLTSQKFLLGALADRFSYKDVIPSEVLLKQIQRLEGFENSPEFRSLIDKCFQKNPPALTDQEVQKLSALPCQVFKNVLEDLSKHDANIFVFKRMCLVMRIICSYIDCATGRIAKDIYYKQLSEIYNGFKQLAQKNDQGAGNYCARLLPILKK